VICEILEHEKMMSAGCRSLAEYKGLVVDEHSQQVEGVAYQGYSSNLIAYVQDGYLTWAGRRKIVDAVAEALRYLHHMGIAHGKVRAENVYLEYRARTVLKGLVEDDYKYIAEDIKAVLGGFASAEDLVRTPEAECVSVMQQDWTDLRMLEQWMRGVLMAQPSV
jgi:serine/threonine protein kinase